MRKDLIFVDHTNGLECIRKGLGIGKLTSIAIFGSSTINLDCCIADWRLSDPHLGLRLGGEREDVRQRQRAGGVPVRAQLLEAARGNGRHQRYSHLGDEFVGYFA